MADLRGGQGVYWCKGVIGTPARHDWGPPHRQCMHRVNAFWVQGNISSMESDAAVGHQRRAPRNTSRVTARVTRQLMRRAPTHALLVAPSPDRPAGRQSNGGRNRRAVWVVPSRSWPQPRRGFLPGIPIRAARFHAVRVVADTPSLDDCRLRPDVVLFRGSKTGCLRGAHAGRTNSGSE
jgi:hypothetical protein